MRRTSWHGTLAALLAAGTLIGDVAPARAQVCGDADGDRRVTVVDGVQGLRAAAFLASGCTPTTCDVDASGSVTIADGIAILRDAAGLSGAVGCGAEITNVFAAVGATSGVTDSFLDVGVAPIPGSSPTLGAPAGRSVIRAGKSATYSIAYEVAPSVQNPSLLITVRDAQTSALLGGFYELALSGSSGVAEFQFLTGERTGEVVVEFFTRAAGQISAASDIDLTLGAFFFCCPIPVCVGGSNADADCANDAACQGGYCTDFVGCIGGPNEDRPCAFNSECPDGLCCPEGPCDPP